MIERIDNGLQIAVLAICGVVALVRALRSRGKPWTLLALFYGSWFLGDVYWSVCLFFYGQTPQISVVSDLSWYAAYIFLYMATCSLARPARSSGSATRSRSRWCWRIFCSSDGKQNCPDTGFFQPRPGLFLCPSPG